MMELCEVIDEFPDDTYPVVMEDCMNKKLDGITRKHLNDINEIVVDEEGGEENIIENKDVIHIYVTENE